MVEEEEAEADLGAEDPEVTTDAEMKIFEEENEPVVGTPVVDPEIQTPQTSTDTDVYHPGSPSGTNLDIQQFMLPLTDFKDITFMDIELFEPSVALEHDTGI